jgi:hypothetical protein
MSSLSAILFFIGGNYERLLKLYERNKILDSEFMNKYHFEILLKDYKNGKSIEEIGEIIKEE